MTVTAEIPNAIEMATQASQIETPVSDREILRRVHEIRSSWDVSERLRRREEADRRFEVLLDTLALHEAA